MTDERTSGPDFLCIGAQKGGTQWLYDQLASHPQFWMPPIKELHCLDLPAKQLEKARKILRKVGRNPEKYNARQREKHRPTVEARDVAFLEKLIDLPRIVDVDRYCSLFDGKGESITGDITPAYSALEPPTITRLAERLPDLRGVFIARDPVERLWSQYSMKIRKKQAPEVIGVDAVLAFASLPSIVSRSFPSRIVDHWRSFFPKEQVGLFFFDELRTD
ncbi:MAG: sulfotransferase, partial [Roseibium sp.]|uniref:sulfotransferase n=1 Tax=Roseibium sp. TaxID=1936156 RepID=UPI0032996BF7